jgi:hypothetical protein
MNPADLTNSNPANLGAVFRVEQAERGGFYVMQRCNQRWDIIDHCSAETMAMSRVRQLAAEMRVVREKPVPPREFDIDGKEIV